MGASLSIILVRLCTKPTVSYKTGTYFTTYTGESIKVLGSMLVNVCHSGQEKSLPLLVVSGDGTNLLGRNWLRQLKLDWTSVFCLQSETELEKVLMDHKDVFNDELETLHGTTVKLHIDPKSVPKSCKARPIPFSLKKKVESKLQRLEAEGVISPVCFSDWATPIVPVARRDGSVHICGDYKITLNRVLKSEVYPVPRIEELFTTLAGGVQFTKLDLLHAYQ